MRGQTTLDFAIGISVFLLTAVLVFGFVPGMLQPFNAGAQEETVAADRLASHLSEGMLAAPDEPYVLQTDCTIDFFQTGPTAGGADPSPACAFDQTTDLGDADGLSARVGMAPRQRINVTIEGDVDGGGADLLCWDEDDDKIVEEGDSECGSSPDQRFRVGDAPTSGGSSVVTARRAVSIAGNDATLVVRVW